MLSSSGNRASWAPAEAGGGRWHIAGAKGRAPGSRERSAGLPSCVWDTVSIRYCSPWSLPFYLVRPRAGETTPFSMSTGQKKKTTALREASMPQPRTAQPCRCRQFDLPLPRTHAHIFARRWLGACMPPPTPPAEVQQSPGVLLQQQNGPSVCFPNAGYRVISTCADAAMPKARRKELLTTCVCMTPLSGARRRRKVRDRNPT